MWIFLALAIVFLFVLCLTNKKRFLLLAWICALIPLCAGCASTPEQKILRKYCADRGSILGDMRCPKYVPPPDYSKDPNYIKYCEGKEGARGTRCYYVHKDNIFR